MDAAAAEDGERGMIRPGEPGEVPAHIHGACGRSDRQYPRVPIHHPSGRHRPGTSPRHGHDQRPRQGENDTMYDSSTSAPPTLAPAALAPPTVHPHSSNRTRDTSTLLRRRCRASPKRSDAAIIPAAESPTQGIARTSNKPVPSRTPGSWSHPLTRTFPAMIGRLGGKKAVMQVNSGDGTSKSAKEIVSGSAFVPSPLSVTENTTAENVSKIGSFE
jgi:hypothetical protein